MKLFEIKGLDVGEHCGFFLGEKMTLKEKIKKFLLKIKKDYYFFRKYKKLEYQAKMINTGDETIVIMPLDSYNIAVGISLPVKVTVYEKKLSRKARKLRS